MAHYVYRCFGADGVLLYVGASKNVPSRLSQHRISAFWSDQVVKVKAKAYPDKEVALEVERRAIAGENPKYNINGKRGGRTTWSDDDFTAHLDRVINSRLSGTSRGRFETLFTEYADRFGNRHPLEATVWSRLDRSDAELHARFERQHGEDREQLRLLRQREAAENRIHLDHCCSCRHGIIVDEDLIESHGNEFDPVETFPTAAEWVA